ncbi:uncharacterized protein LOC132263723 [Phlebotomus argentipes]|uniref:uncharacterized protein LOC132263723 n=1 Tax=Phlebotomus argentipes TaxID=94469 RepID=UPI002892AF7F|nr:uncharacterized protein LOC132263723 [Phlebotomus argentipes]
MSDEQYLAPKRTQKRYEQRFRDAWLQNPLLKDWLRDCYTPDGVREARCLYCNIRLCPRFIDLSKHAMTRKHLRNTPNEGILIDQSSDIEEAEEEQEPNEVDYEESEENKSENIMYEVILDHPNKEVVLEQHSQDDTSLEQLHSQMDASGNSSTSIEPPLKILKMGFKSNKTGGSACEETKEIPVPTTSSRKMKFASLEPNILLERKKLVLQIKNEELRAYKLQLEAFKMERELGFGRSIFTKNLPTKTTL